MNTTKYQECIQVIPGVYSGNTGGVVYSGNTGGCIQVIPGVYSGNTGSVFR
jgi:hypothetical protein